MELLHKYWPHAVGVLGGGSFTFAIVFKDAISKFMQDWTDERRAKRAERSAASGQNDRWPTELIKLLTRSIDDQKATGAALHSLLERMVVADERSLDVQRMTSTQLSDVDKRLTRMEGALRLQQ